MNAKMTAALLALMFGASTAGATAGLAHRPLPLDKAVVACAKWVKDHDDPGFDAYLLHGEERIRMMGSERGKFVMYKCLNSHGHQFGPTAAAPPTPPPPAQLSPQPSSQAKASVPTRLMCLPGYDKAGNQVTRQFTRLYDSAAECERARRSPWLLDQEDPGLAQQGPESQWTFTEDMCLCKAEVQ
jgi:hypothetical protein